MVSYPTPSLCIPVTRKKSPQTIRALGQCWAILCQSLNTSNARWHFPCVLCLEMWIVFFFLLKIYMFIAHSDLIQWKLIGCLPSSLGSSDEELSFPSQRVTWDGTMLLEISRGMHCKNVVAWHPALPWPGRAFCSAFRWTSLSHKTKALGLFTSVRQQQVWLPYTNKIAECSSGMWTTQSLRLEPWFWESLLYVSDAFTTSSVWLTHVTCPVQGLPSGFWSLTPRIIHSIQCPS